MKNPLRRIAGGSLLLAVLAASGYMGSRLPEDVQAVSVPIVFKTMEAIMPERGNPKERLSGERNRALSMIEDVIRDPKAERETVQLAMQQKMRLAGEMETEARLEYAFEQIGLQDVAAVCGKQMVSLIAPDYMALDNQLRMQMIDTAAGIAGVQAQNVKIILAKNE